MQHTKPRWSWHRCWRLAKSGWQAHSPIVKGWRHEWRWVTAVRESNLFMISRGFSACGKPSSGPWGITEDIHFGGLLGDRVFFRIPDLKDGESQKTVAESYVRGVSPRDSGYSR
jgi:hypothetical protein